jgi:hypothetical protein
MFRFTIRDLLWVTLVVGLTIGWWNAERQIAEVKAEFKSLYTDQFNSIAKFQNDMAEKGLVIESDGKRISIRATK